MGRKLASYEKSQRESEREYEREARAGETERRRQKARQEREEEFNESYENSALAISYAHCFFRFTKRNNVHVYLMVDGLDPATDKSNYLIYQLFRLYLNVEYFKLKYSTWVS